MADYSYWKAAVAGQNPKMYVDDPQLGFYRKPVKQRDAKGNNKRVGWEPIAIFMESREIVASIGCNEIFVTDRDRLNELWSYVAGNPVSEEAWRAVAERGEAWPDETIPAADREVEKADNSEPEQPLDVQHATAVDNAIAAAVKKVTSEEEAAQALGSKNRIAELRLAADKAGKAIYEPIYRQYTAEQKKWSPIVKRAKTKEDELETELLNYREKERQRIAAEQAEADRKQREIEEANARMADRAIAAGEPEPPPVVEEAPMVAAPPPITPTYGTRKLKEEVHFILDAVTDYDAVYVFLKEEPKVKALLLDLAAAKVKAGFKVPGTTIREGLI